MRGEVIYVGVALADSPIRKAREKRERGTGQAYPQQGPPWLPEKSSPKKISLEKSSQQDYRIGRNVHRLLFFKVREETVTFQYESGISHIWKQKLSIGTRQ